MSNNFSTEQINGGFLRVRAKQPFTIGAIWNNQDLEQFRAYSKCEINEFTILYTGKNLFDEKYSAVLEVKRSTSKDPFIARSIDEWVENAIANYQP
ncbi:hypothetical protein HOC32_04270 [Candidatus Woesearchaeota archaeon]|nr:hypothetical protein [Candidatus Woesearchaeota archaeon]